MGPILLLDNGLDEECGPLCRPSGESLSWSHAAKSTELLMTSWDFEGRELIGLQRTTENIVQLGEICRMHEVGIAIHPYSSPPDTEWIERYAASYASFDTLHITNMGHMGPGQLRFPGALQYTLSVGVAQGNNLIDPRCSSSNTKPEILVSNTTMLYDSAGVLVYGGTSAAVCIVGSYAAYLLNQLGSMAVSLSAQQLKLMLLTLAEPLASGGLGQRLLHPKVCGPATLAAYRFFSSRERVISWDVDVAKGSIIVFAVGAYRLPGPFNLYHEPIIRVRLGNDTDVSGSEIVLNHTSGCGRISIKIESDTRCEVAGVLKISEG